MSHTIYARGISNRFQDFFRELLNALAAKGISTSKVVQSANEASMDVKKTDEHGSLKLLTHGNDIEITYTTSGGSDDAFKGALSGASGRRGGNALFGMFTGALRGRKRDKSEATYFAEELSNAVEKAEDGVQQILKREKREEEAARFRRG